MEEGNYTHSYVAELRKRIIAVAIFFIIALIIVFYGNGRLKTVNKIGMVVNEIRKMRM